jgi:hypothetical protein
MSQVFALKIVLISYQVDGLAVCLPQRSGCNCHESDVWSLVSPDHGEFWAGPLGFVILTQTASAPRNSTMISRAPVSTGGGQI